MRGAIYNRTIRVTLVDDEWDPTLMEGRATRSYLVADDSPQPSTIWDMIYGLTSRQNEARGFNTLLAINQSSVRVRVPNKYELEIDLPALEGLHDLQEFIINLGLVVLELGLDLVEVEERVLDLCLYQI